MIRFVDEYRDRFGFEFLCRTLRTAVRGFLTSRGYRAAKSRPTSVRQLRDKLLVSEIQRLHAKHYSVYGRRKMHALLKCEGWETGRDQTERLMRLAGVRGVRKSKRVFTTRPDKALALPADLVNRRFIADRPRKLWVCDVTSLMLVELHVSTVNEPTPPQDPLTLRAQGSAHIQRSTGVRPRPEILTRATPSR